MEEIEVSKKEAYQKKLTENGRFVLPLFLGLLGGLFGSQVPGLLYGQQGLLSEKENVAVPETERVREVLQEDEAVIGLVEKSTPGVVSIVISKEIVQSQNPFGNFFFPFRQVPETTEQPGQIQKVGSGSGFFVSSDGLVVTNKHVVSDETAAYTVVVSGGEEYVAKVLARDPTNDIALLKVEGNNFPVLPLGDSDGIKVGQTAIAIGNPLGEFANSVSRGIISGVKRDVTAGSGYGQEERLSNILQTDAAINPGNSGGPLFNISGEVIGVNVAVAQGAENIGFALPINQVKRIVDQVRETGRISTPYIGVRYLLIDEALQKEMNLPFGYGALVLRGQALTDLAVIPGSPADKAGIIENDLILEINGQKIDEEHLLTDLLNEYRVGDTITVKVWSKGALKDLDLVLEERQ